MSNSLPKPNRAWAGLRSFWRGVSVPVTAVIIALLLGALLLWVYGSSPVVAYSALLEGAFGTPRGIQRTLEKATPLIFSGLAVAFAFKAGLFNIGAQGQLVFGALASAVVGYMIPPETMPAFWHVILALIAGCLAGAAYGWIPGALKVWTGAHEVIVTIMLNYIALNITDFLANGPFKDPPETNISNLARTPAIAPSAEIVALGDWLPEAYLDSVKESGTEWGAYFVESIYRFPLGFLLAVVMAAVTAWILWRTTLGYEIRTVGQNPNAAKYAGIRVARTVMLTMAISGLLAGVGGAVETQGVVGRFQPGFNVGLGFEGITIALLAKTNPYGVIPASILVGAMKAGAGKMQLEADVATEIIDVILAMILFFVTAEIIIKWLLRQKSDDEEFINYAAGLGEENTAAPEGGQS